MPENGALFEGSVGAVWRRPDSTVRNGGLAGANGKTGRCDSRMGDWQFRSRLLAQGALLTLLQCLVGILLVSILPVRALSSGPMCRLIAPSDRAGPVNEEEIIDVASCRGGTEACSSP